MVRPAVLPDPAPAAAESGWWAVCLCAEWCGTCRDYRAVFEALAQEHAGVRFVWVDIEDDAELVDELEVETFPTLLIGRGSELLFLGPVPPQLESAERLLAGAAGLADAIAAGLALLHRLQNSC